ncbi:MAG: GNAT family N-acetyltransferase, partial [Burkholderiaceae bacterium]|nr:GNAT family N-acetyltransferase [Burkholderiaceae bacterium]
MTQASWDFSGLTLSTERLHMRPLRESDAARILAIRSKPEVMRYGSSGPWSKIEQAEQLIARDFANMSAGEHLRLTLIPHGQTESIGN